MKKYERVAGIVTKNETFAALNEHMIEVEELCSVMGHLHATEDGHSDKLLATGWRGIAELMHRARAQMLSMATGKLQ